LNVNGRQLQCAKQICDYLTNVLSYKHASSYVKDNTPLKRFFWHIGIYVVKKHISMEFEIVKGSKKIHQMQAHGDPLKGKCC
jgi:hypothetical protein